VSGWQKITERQVTSTYGRSQTMIIRHSGPIAIAAALIGTALPVTAAATSAQASLSPRQLPPYAHGSIAGAGPHSGVRLELVARPKGNFRKGQKVPLPVIGKATSGSAGSYSIRPTVALPDGLHNLEVLARSSSAAGAFSFARTVTRNGRTLGAVDGNGSTKPVTANIHTMALPKSALSAVPRGGPGPFCKPSSTKLKEFGNTWVDVGGLSHH
jgi:hypothetical protein